MGDNVSVDKNRQFIESLQFVQHYEDNNFGRIDIYRFKQPPYQYIMNFKKTFIEGDQRIHGYIKLINQLKNMDHKNLSKIHLCELKEETQMCIKDKKISIFCNYYNFTLNQAIKKKKKLQNRFPQSELIYILNNLLELSLYLKSFGISMGLYRCNSIYLSPEGYLKVYLLQVEESNKHICYYTALAQKSMIEEYILSPQQLQCISQMHYDIKFDLYKADVFAIDDVKFYYNQSYQSWKMSRIYYDLSNMTKIYNQGLIRIIKQCLEEDPTHRYSIQQALEHLNNLKKTLVSVSYCIRLQDDEQNYNKIKPKTDHLIKSQSVFNSIERKLMPAPITPLSTVATSTYRADNKQLKKNKKANFE